MKQEVSSVIWALVMLILGWNLRDLPWAYLHVVAAGQACEADAAIVKRIEPLIAADLRLFGERKKR